MNKIKKILITSDFLMTKEKEQFSNLRWLRELLPRSVKIATGILPEDFSSSLVQPNMLNRKIFFELSDIELDIHATQFWFDDKTISKSSLAYLSDFINEETLLISYELSEQTRNILDKIGVVYIDMWLHPIRYMDDILFAFNSNNGAIFNKMREFNLDPEHYRLYADWYRISTFKGYKRVELPIVKNSALFIGQTLEDKAICKEGKMLTLLDFKSEFERAGKMYSRVYYSRHPFVKSGDEEIVNYVKGLEFARIVDWPAYQMMASNNLEYVFSISSSVVYEALYFGKKTDFLYRPVVELDEEFGQRNYISVYQDFVSPHFWSDVLNPIMKTNKTKRICFLEGKDKLRNMLAFYWSYKHVDKIENMRMQLNAVDARVQRIDKGSNKSDKNIIRNIKNNKAENIFIHDEKKIINDMLFQIKETDVVSFDVFDTLLVRPFEKPEDLFDYISDAAREISAGKINNFREVRLNARAKVDKKNYKGEEVPLSVRYEAIQDEYELTDEQRENLLNLELRTELKLNYPRKLAMLLFDEALKMSKKVIVISDTFFTKEFVAKLLKKNGYEKYSKLYVSSETGYLKHTGNMFDYVLNDLKVKPEKMLHIGDNKHADIDQARRRNVKALHLIRTVDAYEQNVKGAQPQCKNISMINSIRKGLIANYVGNNPKTINAPSYFGGTIEKFGYSIFGPMLLGFTQWLIKSSIRDKYDKLFFLARDGHILKEAYDILSPYYQNAPKSIYLYASRRGVNVPALKTTSEVIKLTDVNFSPMPLKDLLKNRYGVDGEILSAHVLDKHGFSEPDEIVNFINDQKRLKKLVADISDYILENSATERELLLGYFNSKQLTNDNIKKAVVDIGHNGTMQKSISDLIKDHSLGGYYFATFNGIADLTDNGQSASGYVGENIDPNNKNHPYVAHILMFEILFLNNQGSFIRINKKNGTVQPEFRDVTGERERVSFITKMHDSALDFIRDTGNILQEDIAELEFSGVEVIKPYIDMLKSPSILDAKIFQGIEFENVYSGRNLRYIIRPDKRNDKNMKAASIWCEGEKILNGTSDNNNAYDDKIPVHFMFKLAHSYGFLSDRKYKKLINSPYAFFADSKNPLIRSMKSLIKH